MWNEYLEVPVFDEKSYRTYVSQMVGTQNVQEATATQSKAMVSAHTYIKACVSYVCMYVYI